MNQLGSNGLLVQTPLGLFDQFNYAFTEKNRGLETKKRKSSRAGQWFVSWSWSNKETKRYSELLILTLTLILEACHYFTLHYP